MITLKIPKKTSYMSQGFIMSTWTGPIYVMMYEMFPRVPWLRWKFLETRHTCLKVS